MICWNCQWDELSEIEKEVPKFHDLKCSIEFVDKQRQQLAERDEMIASLVNAASEFKSFTILSSVNGVTDYRNHTIKRENLIKALNSTQTTAQAYTAKMKAVYGSNNTSTGS